MVKAAKPIIAKAVRILRTSIFVQAGIAVILVGVVLFMYLHSSPSLLMRVIPLLVIVAGALLSAFPIIHRFMGAPRVDLDLVYALLHMRLIASGKAPPGKVLSAAADPELYGKYSKLFGRAVALAREWGYNLSDALAYLSKGVKETSFREVVQRLSATIRLGANLEKFFETEYSTLFHEYQFQYQRSVNNMRVLLGVYVAIMAAMVFMTSNILLLSFFYGGSLTIVFEAILIGVLVTIGLGLIIIMVLPKDLFEVKGRFKKYNKTLKLIDISAIGATIAAIALAALTIKLRGTSQTSLSIALLVSGIPFIIPGALALKLESEVQDIDVFFPVFIRSLGSFMATVPSLKNALSQVLRAELGKLTRLLTRFLARLENEVPPQIAWKIFAAESGSELVRRGSRIFQDTVEYGGDLVLAGDSISSHNNTLLALRRLRGQVSSNFISSVIIIHATVVAISIFIMGLIEYFNRVIEAIMANLEQTITPYLFFSPINMSVVSILINIFIASLTFINAYLIVVVRPYSKRAFWLFLSILMVVTGIAAYLSYVVVGYLIETMAGIQIVPIPGT
ncbi:MAG: type II secretion system F family protein [Desulfurococcales archaeon]|nr:type II secretion system F family protein [Desulfurococcales archaeon]